MADRLQQLAVLRTESIANYLTSKRQRRPSVRLGEIGHPRAHVSWDTYLKRNKDLYPTTHSGQGYSTIFDGNAPSDVSYVKPGRMAKARPVLHVTDGSHDQDFLNGTLDMHHHDDPVSFRAAVATNRSPTNPSSHVGIAGPKLQSGLKLTNKKIRNGKRRRGGPRFLAPMEEMARAIPQVIAVDDSEKEKGSGLDDIMGHFSDGHGDVDIPEGFRDCDLETSEGFRDTKETCNSQELDYLETKNDSREGRPVYESQQADVAGTCTAECRKRDNVREEREESVNIRIGPMCNATAELPESMRDGQVNSALHTMPRFVLEEKMRLMPESNGSLNDGLLHNHNTDEQLEFSYGALLDGVNGWLLRLGLGRYAPVFQAHEVDIDVLPFLTLDDLREMGINAVGSRRKMFCAIQKLGKCSVTRSDSL